MFKLGLALMLIPLNLQNLAEGLGVPPRPAEEFRRRRGCVFESPVVPASVAGRLPFTLCPNLVYIYRCSFVFFVDVR